MSPDWLSGDYLWYAALAAVLTIGLFVNVMALPGIWLMVAAAGAYAWVTRGQYLGLWGVVILVALGLLSEIVEFVAGGAGARKAGGSTRAAWGALVGGVVGAIFLTIPLFIIGTVIGACLGAFLGAWIAEYSIHGQHDRSMKVGIGAAKGKLLGILSKLAFGFVILVIALWLGGPWRGRNAPAATTPPPPATLPATVPVES